MYIKEWIFKILFSLSSFSGVLLFLFVNTNINIPFIELNKLIGKYNLGVFEFIKYFLIFFCVLIFAKIVLFLSNRYLQLENDLDTVKVLKIKPVEGVYLPIYIGLFVIALSFTNINLVNSYFLITLLFIFWLNFENVAYFNPFFIFLGYSFYEVETEDGITIMLILRRKGIKKMKKIEKLIRINDFTFLQK
ncbi:hypothetical protein CSB07_01575 [Candidatus Gracilibacteria bacterium]|nr:MAG: hypothetical protein CSB07_01575 [Candidatus Gracilibacteria bacterium]